MRVSHCSGFSSCGAQALGHTGFSSCSSRVLEHKLNSCGTGAWLLRGMWDLPRPEIEPESPDWLKDSLPLIHQGSSASHLLVFTPNAIAADPQQSSISSLPQHPPSAGAQAALSPVMTCKLCLPSSLHYFPSEALCDPFPICCYHICNTPH